MDPALLRQDTSLASHTTLQLGGAARYFAKITTEEQLLQCLRWASDKDIPTYVLSGGSNLVISDRGIDGLILHIHLEGLEIRPAGRFTVFAGEPWDRVVNTALHHKYAGIECLAGIPGRAGATPIQNVGAYGQEISQVVQSVRVLDRRTLDVTELSSEACKFSYRNSIFKQQPDRWIVLSVTYQLLVDGPPTLKYPELQRALASNDNPSLYEVRDAILALRQRKSMLLDDNDPHSRSAGSFFTNPIVSTDNADALVQTALDSNLAGHERDVPRYPIDQHTTKLSAAWLIERAGFTRGTRRGSLGISPHHALALVHYGHGSTAELLAFANEIRHRVIEQWGITLEPEPVLWGERWPWLNT